MKNIIGSCYTCKHILILREISPYYGHRRIRRIRVQKLAVLLAVACEEPDVELAFLIQFLEACPAHVAGASGKEYGFLCHDV